MVWIWGLCLLLLIGAAAFYGWRQHRVDVALAHVQAALELKREEGRRLDAELARHLADPQLQQRLTNEQEDLAAKQALMQQLGSLSLQKSQGYAGLMADLARLWDPRLSLQRIEIRDGHINLSGFASRSQDVPAWVNRFKQTPSLAGKQFGELILSRDKEDRLTFQLSGIAREKR